MKMKTWPTKNSAPLSSLFYRCMQQTPPYYLSHKEQPSSDDQLPLSVRQQILDYFVRERIEISADLIVDKVLAGGGVNSFDFWSLCEINCYSDDDVCRIIEQLTLNCDSLLELSIGGPEWIYNKRLIDDQLVNLFVNGKMTKLQSLKLQQANSDRLVYEILSNCESLTKLEIREPSITDQHLAKIADQLDETARGKLKLQDLTLPSSVRNAGLFSCFQLFADLRSLSISNFEPLLDFMDENAEPANRTPESEQFIDRLKRQLEQLNKLTITCPMGQDAVDQIVRYCPQLEELNLEVQEIMHLAPICKLRSLKSLSLHNSFNLPSSFLNDVLPILESIGRQFISLSLEQFDVLDLVEINKLCPGLNSFSAQWFTLLSCGRSSIRLLGDSINVFAMAAAQALHNSATSADHGPRRKTIGQFSNLRLLRLRPRLNRNLSSLAIEYLIRNAKQLQYLELYSCKEFNDDLFARWLEMNGGFKELKYLIVRDCNDDLDRGKIARLLKDSPLMYLELDQPMLSKTELLPLDLLEDQLQQQQQVAAIAAAAAPV